MDGHKTVVRLCVRVCVCVFEDESLALMEYTVCSLDISYSPCYFQAQEVHPFLHQNSIRSFAECWELQRDAQNCHQREPLA